MQGFERPMRGARSWLHVGRITFSAGGTRRSRMRLLLRPLSQFVRGGEGAFEVSGETQAGNLSAGGASVQVCRRRLSVSRQQERHGGSREEGYRLTFGIGGQGQEEVAGATDRYVNRHRCLRMLFNCMR